MKKNIPIIPEGDYGITTYSQEGEDVVLRRFVGEKIGFYVDVGAHHPQRFSNTYYYYKLGWRGINIDADPELMAEFKNQRSNDINVACGVGDKEDSLIFYVFNERAVNTFDKRLADERSKIADWKVIAKKKIPVRKLSQILDQYLPKGQIIDFMSIDIEGKDLEALQSNDWEEYRPRFLLVECFDIDSSEGTHKDIVDFLAKQQYIQVARTYYTAIFADKNTYERH